MIHLYAAGFLFQRKQRMLDDKTMFSGSLHKKARAAQHNIRVKTNQHDL
jgi:hypothetical protein